MASENILVFAIVFLALFFIGGLVGVASLPVFPGRFFISGITSGAFGTGAGTLVIKAIFRN